MRALSAPLDASVSAEVRTSATAGRVLGMLHELRASHLASGVRGTGGGSAVHKLWDRMRRNHGGRARPYRERKVLRHAAERLARGKPPRQRQHGRTVGLTSSRATAASEQRTLQMQSAATVAHRLHTQLSSTRKDVGMRRSEIGGGRAAPVGAYATGVGQSDDGLAHLRLLCGAYDADGVPPPVRGWHCVSSMAELVDHLVQPRKGSALGSWGGVVGEDWVRRGVEGTWWEAVAPEAEGLRGQVQAGSMKGGELRRHKLHKLRGWHIVRGNAPSVTRDTSRPAWTPVTAGKNSLWLCGNGTLVQFLPVWGLRLLRHPLDDAQLRRTMEAMPEGALWDAVARGVHVGAIAEVLRTTELRLRPEHRGQLATVVHHCAGELNGMWHAARAGFSGGAELLGLSEIHGDTCALLRRLYPGVRIALDARQLASHTAELGARWVLMGWPCPPYSTAARTQGRGARDRAEREADRWLNTQLVCDVLRLTFTGMPLEAMPWGVVLENVPGLLSLQANAPYRRMIARCMAGLPLVWRVGLVCPAADWGDGMEKQRVIFAGVRADML